MKDITELGLPAWSAALQFVNQHAQMTDPRTRRDVSANLRVECDQSDAVLLLQHQLVKRRGPARRVFIFARATTVASVIHRPAQIEQQRCPEVRLLLIFPNVIPVRAREDTPVDMPDFVARDILPMLLEFDTETLVRRTMQPAA